MKNCFAYLRVSTARQGNKGVSLQEQRDDIIAYAQKHNLNISAWFEERESAAKYGARPVFSEMIKKLKAKKAGGIIFHKIDRSSRNMTDWAELERLHDAGFEIHFTVDNLDMHSLSERMVAGIQAVMAANYSRNLRQEARKGFKGRLKQGFYPLAAPIGYLDKGGGKLKEIDPVNGPLMRKAFELYATGEYSIDDLRHRLQIRTWRSHSIISKNTMAKALKNPFYIGLLKIKTTGEVYKGKHTPLISQKLFYQVQDILEGKIRRHDTIHKYAFARVFKCALCGYSLTGEMQKGRVYYRCHTKTCETTSIREDRLHKAVTNFINGLTITEPGLKLLKGKIEKLMSNALVEVKANQNTKQLRLEQISANLARLTDAFVDGMIEKDIFQERRAQLLIAKDELEIEKLPAHIQKAEMQNRVTNFFELLENVSANHNYAIGPEKTKLLKSVSSNRTACQKSVYFEPRNPWCEVQKCASVSYCGGQRTRLRTEMDKLAKYLYKYFEENNEMKKTTTLI